jgi:hypothetical protein
MPSVERKPSKACTPSSLRICYYGGPALFILCINVLKRVVPKGPFVGRSLRPNSPIFNVAWKPSHEYNNLRVVCTVLVCSIFMLYFYRSNVTFEVYRTVSKGFFSFLSSENGKLLCCFCISIVRGCVRVHMQPTQTARPGSKATSVGSQKSTRSNYRYVCEPG